MDTDINLIYPPFTLPTSPYSSLPYLKGGLCDKGIGVDCFDLNIEAFNYLFFNPLFSNNYQIEQPQNAINQIKGNIDSFLNKETYQKSKESIESFFDKLNSKLKSQSVSFGGYLFHDFKFSYLNLKELANNPDNLISNFYKYYLEKTKFNSNLFGISITYDFQFIPGILFAYIIKKRNSNAKIIIGGASMQYLSQFVLTNNWLFKIIDVMVIGDGVDAIVNYINGKELPQNCFYLNAEEITSGNQSLKNEFKNYSSPDYSCLPIDKYLSPLLTGIVLSSVGCYYGKCSFCIPSNGKNQKYELRPINKLINDIKSTNHALNSDLIFFGDDSINIGHISRLLSDFKQPLNWQGEFRFESNLAYQSLSLFKNNGCLQILFGLESSSPRVLKKMNKGITLENVNNILDYCKQLNVLTNIQTIIGFPSESIEEAYGTASFLNKNKNKINSCAVSPFALYKGSFVYNNPVKFNIEITDDNFICNYINNKGINQKQSKTLSKAFFDSLKEFFPSNDYFLDGPMGNHAMIYYKHNIKI